MVSFMIPMIVQDMGRAAFMDIGQNLIKIRIFYINSSIVKILTTPTVIAAIKPTINGL